MSNNIIKSSPNRINLLFVVIVLICSVFIARLFYLQVIRHDYYSAQAQDSQLRKYEIIAERGAIFAMDGEERVPLVLNERRYRIVADPKIITDKSKTAEALVDVLKVSKDDIIKLLEKESRYEVLAKNQTKEVKETIEKLYSEGKIMGVFAEKTTQRVYPHGALAAQVLGIVDDEGVGKYGVEEAINNELSGTNGRVKALTDHNGIPLLANGENVLEDPVDGQEVTLTIDVAMQRQLEILLKQGLDNAKSSSGSAIIIDPNTGAIKAMANYPSFDPAQFRAIEDFSLFTNDAVSSPLEPGSIMKTLTAAAALDTGSVTANQSYFDPSSFKLDGATVRNIEEDGGAATRTVSDILRFSLNTGATWLLMQMGGGEVNEQARKVWHDYMTNHYQFGKKTGVEQGFEEPGYIPDPLEGYGLNIRYANTSFGQGMTVTPLQMAAALSAVVNGGTYYQPTVVAGYTNNEDNFAGTDPKIVRTNVVSSETSATIISFMNNVVEKNNRPAVRAGYQVGGKTGTAEIAKPEGGYFEDKFNGTYVGYVGGDKPEYVVMVRVNEPGIAGYAGSRAAGPLWASVTNMLIDNFSVQAISGN